MKDFEEIDDNINELLLQKRFSDLTVDEKNRVLQHAANETEYNQLRETLLAITSSFTTEEEDFAADDVKHDLMAQFEKKFGSDTKKTPVVPLYRKPFFQLAVAACIGLLLFLAIPLLNNPAETNKELALNHKTNSNNGDIQNDSNVIPNVSANGLNPGQDISTEGRTTILDEEKKAVEKTIVADEISTIETNTSTKTLERANKPISSEQDLARSAAKNDNTVINSQAEKNSEIDNQKNKDLLYADDYSSYNKIANEKLKKKAENERKEDVPTTNAANIPASRSDESITGAVMGAVSNASVNNTGLVQTERFIEQNTGEMIDLLFTTF